MKKDYRNISKGIVSVLIVVIIVSGLLSLLASLKKLTIFDGFRASLEEYFPGGPSPGEEGDDGEGSSDGSGDGSADDTGDSEDSEESRCDHRDKNDNDICDKCGEGFWDGDEPGTETPTPDTPIDPEEPEEPEEPECEHLDADDNDVCDECNVSFSDGDNPDIGLLYSSSYIDNSLYSYSFNILTEKNGVRIESLIASENKDNISFPLHISVDEGYITNLKFKIDSSYDLNRLTIKVTDEDGNDLVGDLRFKDGYVYFYNDNSAQTCLNIYVYSSYESEDGEIYSTVPLDVDKTDDDEDGKADSYAISVAVQKTKT